jgi:Icc-related predicted phosphoesterase
MKKLFLCIGILGIAAVIGAYYQLKYLTVNHTSFLPPAGEHFHPEKTHFKVAFFSDNGLRERSLEKITDKLSKDGNEFAVFCGDIAEQRSFNGFAHLSQELAEKLTIPLYAIPGNHDMDKDGGLKLFHQFFGQERYYFSYGDTLFIGLNTSDSIFTQDDQKWLASVLREERQRFRRCVIYCHVPPADLHVGKQYHLHTQDAERFYDAIKNYPVNLIVSGHIHTYIRSKFHDVDLLILPASGQGAHIKNAKPYDGFVELSFNDDGTITPDAILYPHSSERERLEYYFSIFASYVLWLGIVLILLGGIMIYRSEGKKS